MLVFIGLEGPMTITTTTTTTTKQKTGQILRVGEKEKKKYPK